MRAFKHITGKTLEEQLASIDGILDVVLRRDRLKEEKITRMLKSVKDTLKELKKAEEVEVVDGGVAEQKLLTEKTDAPK